MRSHLDASLSKLPLDGVVKGRDHARRLCDAMWHASGLEPRMLGTKRFAFVGEQRAVRKAREEAKEREQQRLKALAAQKKRQQRTQAAQKEKASVGAAKAKEAGPGTDPKTPKGRAAREGGKKDKERRGSQPSDKSHGANAKSRGSPKLSGAARSTIWWGSLVTSALHAADSTVSTEPGGSKNSSSL